MSGLWRKVPRSGLVAVAVAVGVGAVPVVAGAAVPHQLEPRGHCHPSEFGPHPLSRHFRV
jgi:hypothetical protein